MITIRRRSAPIYPADRDLTTTAAAEEEDQSQLVGVLAVKLHGALLGRTSTMTEINKVWVPGALIVGAGPAGLAAAACLRAKGVPSLVLERENCIASLWKQRAYDRLRLHLPKRFCELPLVPFPADFPTYPSRSQFVGYLEAYARRFAINPVFGVEVRRAEYDGAAGLWRVRDGDGLEFLSRWLVVATGENAEAVLPDIGGVSDFRGTVLHSSSYKNGADFRGQRVLVVGCGNSGMELCLDLCNNGAQPSIVVRDKVHVLPREILGRSTFGLSMWLLRWLPVTWVDRLLLLCSRVVLGDTERLGLERPEMGPLQLKNTAGKTPVLDVGALAKIKTGQIKVVPAIRRFSPGGVDFADGRKGEFDAVVFATGYRSNVPSWLKENEFFGKDDGLPRNSFPNSWMGKNGLYATGFARRGLLGLSADARRIADHVAARWNSEAIELSTTTTTTTS